MQYSEPKPLPARRAKHAVEPLAADPRYATAANIFRILRAALDRIQSEIDVLTIEGHLNSRPDDPRAPQMKAQLKIKRESMGRTASAPKAQAGMPPSVVVALNLINDGVRPRRQNRQAEIAQLEKDAEIVRDAIFEQQPILDAALDELSHEAAKRHSTAYQKLVLAQYRAAQALAAAADAEREFRAEFASAGYIWRQDVMHDYQLRAALILGSEHDFDSEIARVRRFLEGVKILK